MSVKNPIYEGDGLVRRAPSVEDIEREARKMRAVFVGAFFRRIFDWLERWAYASWQRERERHLAQASDLADLERRMRNLDARRNSFS
jgi:hypothetical protein